MHIGSFSEPFYCQEEKIVFLLHRMKLYRSYKTRDCRIRFPSFIETIFAVVILTFFRTRFQEYNKLFVKDDKIKISKCEL